MRKNNVKKIVSMMLATTLFFASVVAMTACGGKKKDSKVGEGTYKYEQTVLNVDDVESVPYSFGNGTLPGMTRAFSVEMKLEDNGTYTMDVRGWMQEDTEGNTLDVGDDFQFGEGMYAEWSSSAKGTYTSEENVVTTTATEATFKIPDLGASYMAQLFGGGNAAGGSFNQEGEDYFGEWSSADYSEILDLFPETEFFIDGSNVINWVKVGYSDAVKTDEAEIYFYSDGTAIYRDIANKDTENVSWEASNDEITVTYVKAGSMDGSIPAETFTFTGSASKPLEITVNEKTNSFTLSADDITAITK